MDADHILKVLADRREVIRRMGVRRLGLFGSMVRGQASDVSDLDFIVEFERKSFDTYMDLKAYLEDLFGLPVDLVLAETLKTRLRPAILKEALYAPGL